MGSEEGSVEGGVSLSFNVAWSGQDSVVDDHVGDGADQPVCDRGEICVLLSEGTEPVWVIPPMTGPSRRTPQILKKLRQRERSW